MLPNLKHIIKRFSQNVKLIRVTKTIVNHLPTESEVITDIKAVVQVPQKNKISKDNLDYSLRYIEVHSEESIKLGDILEHKGIRYKAIEIANNSDYGFYNAIMEEIK